MLLTVCDHKVINDPETSEEICIKCGTVLCIHRPTIDAENVSTILAPAANLGLNLATLLSNNDSQGRNVKAKYYHLIELNKHTFPILQRNISRGHHIIRGMAAKLYLSEAILERGLQIYTKVAKAQLTKGRSINGIACACLYLAAKDCRSPRTAAEFKAHIPSEYERKRFFKDYRHILLYLQDKSSIPLSQSVINPTTECVRLASKLPEQLSGRILHHACELYNVIKKNNPLSLVGKHPTSMAAALLYVACLRLNELPYSQLIRQGELVKVSGMSLVSLRLRYKQIITELEKAGYITRAERDHLQEKDGRWKRSPVFKTRI